MTNKEFRFDTDGFKYYDENYVKHPSKSATTGTTGSYPYHGMGRKVLKKNMVSGVNTLTQSMMSAANTIYVIKYDYVLGANITIPANCVLEFDGGSVSASGSNDTITLNNTTFRGENIVFTNIVLSGTLTNKTIKLSWVGGSISRMLGINPSGHTIAFDVDTTADATINYSNKSNIIFDGCNNTITVGAGVELFKPEGEYSNVEIKNFVFEGTVTSAFFAPNSSWNVTHENVHIHHNTLNTCFLGISLNADLTGEFKDCSVHDNVIKMNQADNSEIGSYGIHLANANYTNIYNNYVSGCGRHALYVAWGHDINIFNNVFEDNDIGVIGIIATLAIFRKSQNVNVYGNKFLNNGACAIMIEHGETEWEDEEHTIESRRTKGNIRNVNVYDNLIEQTKRTGANGVMVGYYTETDYTYFEENIKIHHNSFIAGAGYALNNSMVLTSGKNIEVTENLFDWEDSDDFTTVKGSNTVITFRQNPSLTQLAQEILQDFKIKNNIFEGPDKTDFTYFPLYIENLRANACFTKGLIKDNVMNGLFERKSDTVGKGNINPTIFPLAYDYWLRKNNTARRPALTSNTPFFEYFDTDLDKPIFWNGSGWIDATGTTV